MRFLPNRWHQLLPAIAILAFASGVPGFEILLAPATAKMLRCVAPLPSRALTAAVPPGVLTTRIDATAAMILFARSVEASMPAR